MENYLNHNIDTKIMEHQEFIKRIKKTLYYGASSSSAYQCDRISRPLADYTAEMFSETHKGTSLNRLDFVTVTKLKITPCSLILSMIYFDRLNERDPIYARKITPSELFLVSMMVSTKFYCGYDEDIYLSAWAEYGNMTIDYLKELELDFLDAMNWEIYVSNGEFFEKLKDVERVLAKRQGLKRGWLTYTELIRLLPTFSLAKKIINYSTILALSYVAGVMTIFGGFFIASQVPGSSLSNNLDARTAATTSSSTHKTSTSTTRTTVNKANRSSIRCAAGHKRPLSSASQLIPKDPRKEEENDLTLIDEDETEIDYMMEDLNESIENYDEENVVEAAPPPCNNFSDKNAKRNNSQSNILHDLNALLQTKCNYGKNVGINNGVLLKNYLDDDGNQKNRTNSWSWLAEFLNQKKYDESGKSIFNPSMLFPTIWLKFI